jgi:hypothetical protein
MGLQNATDLFDFRELIKRRVGFGSVTEPLGLVMLGGKIYYHRPALGADFIQVHCHGSPSSSAVATGSRPGPPASRRDGAATQLAHHDHSSRVRARREYSGPSTIRGPPARTGWEAAGFYPRCCHRAAGPAAAKPHQQLET